MTLGEIVLQTDRLTRRFGGLIANDCVDIVLRRNEIHGLLGPNGAGKSTLINMLSGDLSPTQGTIHFQKLDISRLSSAKRARIGVGRSYQITNIFKNLTVFENVRLAAQARNQRTWHVLSNALSDRRTTEIAADAIEEVGLRGHDRIAGLLSHGEQRQLEIAMVLATRAEVFLLDEPLAGMGSEESAQIIELLRRLRQARAILLVEHDLDAIFALADVITVMVNGRVLESGTPENIRGSAQVQKAYLGPSEMAHV